MRHAALVYAQHLVRVRVGVRVRVRVRVRVKVRVRVRVRIKVRVRVHAQHHAAQTTDVKVSLDERHDLHIPRAARRHRRRPPRAVRLALHRTRAHPAGVDRAHLARVHAVHT